MPTEELSTEQVNDLARFKQAEQLGHVLAYKEMDQDDYQAPEHKELAAKDGLKRAYVDDEDGVKRTYLVRRVQGTHAGLVSFVLYSDDVDNPRVHVTFRGTHNLASTKRDLENPSAPGKYSYITDEDKIMSTIRDVVQHKQATSKQKIELSISGHSLGGADCQNCAAAVIHDIAEKKSPLANIDGLNIMHINGVGVGHSVEVQVKNDVQKIKVDDKNPIKIRQFIIAVGGDAVQQTGYTSILADLPPEQVDTKYLKAEISVKRELSYMALILAGPLALIKAVRGKPGTFEAHTLKVYDHVAKGVVPIEGKAQFKIYHNKKPEDALFIKNELHNKVLKKLYKPVAALKKVKTISPMQAMHRVKNNPNKGKPK
jgi:hypothetical protein